MSWKQKQGTKTGRKGSVLAYPVANADARVPRADFMLKAGADFVHIQAGWEMRLLWIATAAPGLSKTLLRHSIGKETAV